MAVRRVGQETTGWPEWFQRVRNQGDPNRWKMADVRLAFRRVMSLTEYLFSGSGPSLGPIGGPACTIPQNHYFKS